MGQLNTRFADTHAKLEQWGKWQKEGFGRIGYRRTSSGFDQVSASRGTGYAITDDEAMAVDSQVAHLKKKDPEMGGMIESYFCYGMNLATAADYHKMGRHKASMLLNGGVAWVDARLFDIDVAA